MRHIMDNAVLRNPLGDCTNRGLTSVHDTVTVITDVPYLTVRDGGKTYFDKPDENKVLEYCRENNLDHSRTLILCDKRNNPVYTPYLKPLDAVYACRGGKKMLGPMDGGNRVRVRMENGDETIRVHDRYEED